MDDKHSVILGLPGHTRRTAHFIARTLGISYINHPDRQCYGLGIRWGNSERGLNAGIVINPREGIVNAANKLRALSIMFKADVSVPKFFRLSGGETEDEIIALMPGFIRAKYHQAGYSLLYCADYNDFTGKMGDIDFSPDYIIREVEKVREYRVHVGKVEDIEMLYVQRKLRQESAEDNKVWNYEGGWRYHTRPLHRVSKRITRQAQEAVAALGLHFGAVDLIQDSNGDVWVIEVNTAPGLCPESARIEEALTPSQETYIKFFREVIDNVRQIY